MVEAAEFTGALDRADVGCLFDDTDQRRITPRIAADHAELIFREVEAAFAGMNADAQGNQCFGEPVTLLRWLLEQMIREAKRRLAADAWQLGELGSEIVDDRQGRESSSEVLGIRC